MRPIQMSTLLRRALIADATISGATGLMMFGAASLLTSLLGVPFALLQIAGLSLLPYAAILGLMSRRETLSATAVGAVIAANGLWVAGSILLLVAGWVAPTLLGSIFILAQALVVAGFAEAQFVGLRRSAPAAA